VAASIDSRNLENQDTSCAPAQGQPRAGEEASSSNGPDKPHSLFVLKKTGVEHLRAQHCLTEMLRCRQADLGLAGIKDTVATTYQSCTVRNYDSVRLVRTLQKHEQKLRDKFAGIEVGQVRAWLLRKGELDGNRSQIVLRNVRRVQVVFDKDGSARETFGPCDVEHCSSRIDTVAQCGFCNFYGEQRVGIPGLASNVGVRAFEVGRSMLQQNYRDAIDKIMTGRIITRVYDNREPDDVQKVRRTWKETGGDPHRTWKALPRGAAMAREHLILKGLKRYGARCWRSGACTSTSECSGSAPTSLTFGTP
jgi:tRNA(Glu) U13 pseudouridine synthase TruD